MPSLVLLSLGGLLACLAFAARDLASARRGGVTPATMYAIGAAAANLSNMIAHLAADGPNYSLYFPYLVEDKLFLATMLQLAGSILPILGFDAIARVWSAAIWTDLLPPVSGRIRDKHLVVVGSALALVAIATRIRFSLEFLGTLSAVVFFLPHFAAFTLARAGTERRVRWALEAALAIAVLEAVRAAYMSYLRSDIIAPVFAFVIGALLGARSLRPLRSPHFVPIYVFGAMFVFTFGRFGELRSQVSGAERITALYEYGRDGPDAADTPRQQTVLMRLSSVNQLSQVGRIVQEDGFLNGQTLEYLGYAFIPRFLWPEKPTIAKGAWFALRIGQARVLDGRITNSVNMTIPGELYMNFGWAGTILGSLVFGVFLAALWRTTRFWTDPRNTLGNAFGYYLLWSAFGLGADLQLLVTAIAVYLTFVAAAAVLKGRAAPVRVVSLASARRRMEIAR